MADAKITALTALTLPELVDLLSIVDDPAGSPILKKITVGDLIKNATWVLPEFKIATNNADFTGTAGNAVQPIFQAANDALTVLASTSYWFKLFLSVTNGTTTATKALAFAGTATLTSIRYKATGQNVAINTTGTAQSTVHIDTAASTVVLATGTTSWWIEAEGIIRVNAGGTLIPQFQFSANPTGTVLVKKDSYIMLFPFGSNTVAAVGPWG